jgi:hypothetical protein
MHLNPLRKGLVKRPEEWPWSSYNNAGGAYIAFLAMCAITADGRWEGWTPPPGNRTGSSTTATGQAT